MTIKYIENINLNSGNTNIITGSFTESTESFWSSSTTYAIGAKVRHPYYDSGGGFVSYRIYASKQDSNLNHTPPSGLLEDDWWVLAGVDTRYAYLDYGFGTESYTTSSPVEIQLSNIPTTVDIIQLINITAEIWYIYDSANTLFASGNLISGQNGDADRRKNLTVEIPAANLGSSYKIRLLRTISQQIKIAQLVVGYARELEGDLQYGLSLDAEDFSVNTTNEFGNVQLVQRPYIKRVSASIVIPNTYFNQYHRAFAARRAKNTVWVLTDEVNYNETVIFGTGKCSLLANYATDSIAQVEIKGSI